ncbi:MAG: lytic transglycosylase domain-containing protein [Odoribacter sp.]|nr:lytic transglycosylase domain-containing protein [Odoribacter sp.]
MNKIQNLLYLCITLFTIALFSIIFYARKLQTAETVVPESPSLSDIPFGTNVFLPDTLTLAGEAVPLHRPDVREALEKEVIVNTYLHSHTIQLLQSAPRIFAVLEPLLKANGIPDDFKYLAVIESRLNPLAVSPAGAVGMWQIMKNTAKELGLEVNNEVDERYHVEKSTLAATKYLKKAYDKFGTWTLAAASYNAGFSMLSKQMKIQQEEDYYNLLLGEETERYVFRILALKQILTHPEKYHFNVENSYPPEPTHQIEVKGSVRSWADFAKEQGITYKTLKRFNPWLRKNDLKNYRRKTYQISIPENTRLYQ